MTDFTPAASIFIFNPLPKVLFVTLFINYRQMWKTRLGLSWVFSKVTLQMGTLRLHLHAASTTMLQWFARRGEGAQKCVESGFHPFKLAAVFHLQKFKLNTWVVDFKKCPHQNTLRNKTKRRLGWEEEEGWEGGGGDQETKEQSKFPVHSVSVRNLMVVFTFSPWMFSLKALL